MKLSHVHVVLGHFHEDVSGGFLAALCQCYAKRGIHHCIHVDDQMHNHSLHGYVCLVHLLWMLS